MTVDNYHLKELLEIRLTEELLKDYFIYAETRTIKKWVNKLHAKIIELQEEMNLEYDEGFSSGRSLRRSSFMPDIKKTLRGFHDSQ